VKRRRYTRGMNVKPGLFMTRLYGEDVRPIKTSRMQGLGASQQVESWDCKFVCVNAH